MAFPVGAYYQAGSVGIRSNTRKYPCTSALLAYMVRACTHSNFSAVSLLHNVNMATHVDRYNQPGSTNVLARLSSFRRGELGSKKNMDQTSLQKDSIKGAIILFACQDWSSTPSPNTQHARGRTTGWSCQRTLLFEQTDSKSTTL